MASRRIIACCRAPSAYDTRGNSPSGRIQPSSVAAHQYQLSLGEESCCSNRTDRWIINVDYTLTQGGGFRSVSRVARQRYTHLSGEHD